VARCHPSELDPIRIAARKEQVMIEVRRFAVAIALLVLAPVEVRAQVCIPPLCVGPVDFPLVPSLPLGITAPPPNIPPPPPGCSDASVAMTVLVLSADGTETVLPAIQQALDYHSVPHETWIASQRPGQLVPTALATGCTGRYQGVILTTGALSYTPDGGQTFLSALSPAEWIALRTYEAQFGAREIAWYVFPGADNGLNPATAGQDTGASPINATLTSAGQAAFPYLNAANPIPITLAWTYLTTAADPAVTPLLVDSAGHVLMSSRVGPDGRETLAITFDSNPYLLHHVTLAHGLVEWLTRGVYLGEYRVYLTPQVDDLYNDDDLFGGGSYRMAATDVTTMQTWQLGVQAIQGNGAFRLAFAFNGSYSTLLDLLSITLAPVSASFNFINHTWTHPNLDTVSYNTAQTEIGRNDSFGRSHFVNYSTQSLVTPEISGLLNPNAMRAAKDVGVRYMTSDTSRAGWDNPRPNIGIYSTLQPSILFVPRRPTNLFYNVSVPAKWVNEYNSLYATYWGRNLSYAEVLDKESQFLLFYMLRGDIDPQMYHQSNMRAYDGTHSLLSDLHDLALQKLRRYSNLPMESPDMVHVGTKMANTMARDTSGLSAVLRRGVSVTLTSPTALHVVVSGVCQLLGSEVYGGKCITGVDVPAGGTVTMPL
jgi:hypothetical protein